MQTSLVPHTGATQKLNTKVIIKIRTEFKSVLDDVIFPSTRFLVKDFAVKQSFLNFKVTKLFCNLES